MNELTERLCNYLNQYGEVAVLTTEVGDFITVTTCGINAATGDIYIEYYSEISCAEFTTLSNTQAVLDATRHYRLYATDADFRQYAEFMLSNLDAQDVIQQGDWLSTIYEYATGNNGSNIVFAF